MSSPSTISGKAFFMHKNKALTKSPNTSDEILTEKSASGRKRPWEQQKNMALKLAEAYREIFEDGDAVFKSTVKQLKNCGTFIHFKACPSENHYQRLESANFCHHRLCPMCQWRRSMKAYQEFLKIAHRAQEESRYPNFLKPGKKFVGTRKEKSIAFLHLVLTVKNVFGDDLKPTITHMLKAWKEFVKLKPVKKILLGYYRTIEVNYSDEEGFHPHFHVILEVRKSYKNNSRDYIRMPKKNRTTKKYIIKPSQLTWVQLWREAGEFGYFPNVHIEKIKSQEQEHTEDAKKLIEAGEYIEAGEASAVAEVAKYTSKVIDLLNSKRTKDILPIMDDALYKRRLKAYGGHLRRVYQFFAKTDEHRKLLKKGEINCTDPECEYCIELGRQQDKKTCEEDCCPICNSGLVRKSYLWDSYIGNYIYSAPDKTRRTDPLEVGIKKVYKPKKETFEPLEKWEKEVNPIHVILAQRGEVDVPKID